MRNKNSVEYNEEEWFVQRQKFCVSTGHTIVFN